MLAARSNRRLLGFCAPIILAPISAWVRITAISAALVGSSARRRCAQPAFLLNVARAGEMTLETLLHRPPARTVAPWRAYL